MIGCITMKNCFLKTDRKSEKKRGDENPFFFYLLSYFLILSSRYVKSTNLVRQKY